VLTADLVSARRRGGELQLVKMDADRRARTLAIAESIIGVTSAHVGATRDLWQAAVQAIEVAQRDLRLKRAVTKLVEDRTEFGLGTDVDPPALRRDVFSRAATARRAAETRSGFDRDAVLDDAARHHGMSKAEVEAALYADLRGAQVLRRFDPISAAAITDDFDRSQAQAVLLRAVRVTVDVDCASAPAARRLFRRLKFLQLLCTVARAGAGYRIVIDGPFSLFESVTKYGLKFAQLLPVLDECETWNLVADVRWGKDRAALSFRLSGQGSGGGAEPELAPELAALGLAFDRLATGWKRARANAILDLPGVGLCVPDMVFVRGREKVYLELLGYWSRDAVFRRIDLVEKGLPEKIIFAASARLRVSEQLLGEQEPACLYVFKTAMSARAVAERVERLAARR
jgi:predicted nuclease of restriction endonuclease-like RecB superfamily